MNIIRLNRRTLIKVLIFVLLCLTLKVAIESLFAPQLPSLEFNYSKREFSIRLNKAHFVQGSNRLYNDFYLVDQSQNSDYSEFVLQNFQIKSASFPYSKILLQDWVSSIENIVKLGLNTIEIEIVWNLHEQNPNQFDFKTNNLDLEEFIKLVDAYKLFLIVRIDPYLPCSEYDLGGLPNWLLIDEADKKNLIVNQAFENYLKNVLQILSRYQLTNNNGPLIGVLIQFYEINNSKVDSYQNLFDDRYKAFMLKQLSAYGIDEIVLKTINHCEFNKIHDELNYKKYCDSNLNIYFPLDFNIPNTQSKFYNCFENDFGKYWNATYKMNQQTDLNKQMCFKSNLNELLTTKKSFNINKFICLSYTGFWSGARYDELNENYLPISTSSFNAHGVCLVDETGYLTNKYLSGLNLLKPKSQFGKNFSANKISYKLSELNEENLVEIRITHFLPYEKIVKNLLHAPVLLNPKKNELYMEYLNINYNLKTHANAYILYRLKANLKPGAVVFVNTKYVRDYAMLMCDYKNLLLTIDHSKKRDDSLLAIRLNFDCTEIHVLVENMGRLSNLKASEKFTSQRKGILSKDAIYFKRTDKNSYETGGSSWMINFFDFSPKFFNRIAFNSEYLNSEEFKTSNFSMLNAPLMAYAKFNLIKTNKNQNVYLLLKKWNKGAVFLNGYNLGRYYHNGPLLTLYVPKSYLNNGPNEIIVFDLHGNGRNNYTFFFTDSHVFL